MAVINFNESLQSRSASLKTGEGATYSRSFTVAVDDPNTPLLTIMRAPGVRLWSRHPHDYWAFAKSFDVKPRGSSHTLYDVTVQYSMLEVKDQNREEEEPGSATNPDPTANPLLMPGPVWSGGSALREVVVTEDVGGKAIVNSAGVSYPNPTRREPCYTISAVICYPTYTAAAAAISAITGCTNLAAWAGGLVGEWLCESTRWNWRSEASGNQRLSYVEATFDCVRLFGGHDLKLVDQGFAERVAGKLVPIMKDGSPVTEPVNLDGSGREMSPPPGPTKKSFVNTFAMHRKVNFTNILGDPPATLPSTPAPPAP